MQLHKLPDQPRDLKDFHDKLAKIIAERNLHPMGSPLLTELSWSLRQTSMDILHHVNGDHWHQYKRQIAKLPEEIAAAQFSSKPLPPSLKSNRPARVDRPSMVQP
jgi:hypothetical protein